MHIHLNEISTRAPKDFNKAETKEETVEILKELNELQNRLYASKEHSLLVVIQGMDASGKDGLVRDVFTSMNPQGVRVTSFKEPSLEELSHDFLWRIHKEVPAKGMIQVFNRSHYEDVIVTRVHGLIDDHTARERMQAINDFEKLLQQNNTHLLKFYLYVSAEEQQERLEERMKNPAKMWKYNANDKMEASKRNDYIRYTQEVFEHCSQIPWHIIPADQNWYKAHLVAKTIKETLEDLDLQYPPIKKSPPSPFMERG